MKKTKYIFVVISLYFGSLAQAYNPQEGNISAVFGPVVSKAVFEGPATGSATSAMTGIGLLAIGDVNTAGSLEIGVFHLTKQFYREQNGLFVGEQTNLIQIDMGYRMWLGNVFSIGLFLFSSYTIGDFAVVHNDLPAGQTLETSARDTTEYGASLSILTELLNRGPVAMMLDTRYSYDVTKRDDERADHFSFLIGLRFLLQEKVAPPPRPQTHPQRQR
ncbi:MAG: hypothetical protein ABL958_13765 [Bdellovibrionia bacterium]